MPKYQINLRSQSHVAETLEIEREDVAGLRIELARFVGELMKEHAEEIWIDQDWQIDVSDEAGLILYVVQISAYDTPATMRPRPVGL